MSTVNPVPLVGQLPVLDHPTPESIASALAYRRVEQSRIEAAFVSDGASPSLLAALRRSFV